MRQIYKNDKVEVTVNDDESCISFYDLTDKWNDTKGFTQNKRGIKVAVKTLENHLQKGLTFGQVTQFLSDLKLKPHTYCGMD